MNKPLLPSYRAQAMTLISVLFVIIAVATSLIGHQYNERVEDALWREMLHLYQEQIKLGINNTQSQKLGTATLYLSEQTSTNVPEPFRALKEGFHDDIEYNEKLWAVFVDVSNGRRSWLAFDITQMEADERSHHIALLIGLVVLLFVLILAAYFIAGKLSSSLESLASSLSAETTATQLAAIDFRPTNVETEKIVVAIRSYIDRINGFLQREKQFLAMASHELRTPIAVISGASELIMAKSELNDSNRKPLARILRATKDANLTLSTLLFLAKEGREGKLAETNEFDLVSVVEKVVSDHEYLLMGEQRIVCNHHYSGNVSISEKLFEIVLSNLLRNAIQHGASSDITVESTQTAITLRNACSERPSDVIFALTAPSDALDSSYIYQGYGLLIIKQICQKLSWKINVRYENDELEFEVNFVPPTAQ